MGQWIWLGTCGSGPRANTKQEKIGRFSAGARGAAIPGPPAARFGSAFDPGAATTASGFGAPGPSVTLFALFSYPFHSGLKVAGERASRAKPGEKFLQRWGRPVASPEGNPPPALLLFVRRHCLPGGAGPQAWTFRGTRGSSVKLPIPATNRLECLGAPKPDVVVAVPGLIVVTNRAAGGPGIVVPRAPAET